MENRDFPVDFENRFPLKRRATIEDTIHFLLVAILVIGSVMVLGRFIS
jgi:hypothetical protein